MDSCFRHKNAEFVRILRFLSIAYRKNTTILVHMPLKWGYDTALNIINIHLFPSRFKTSDCLCDTGCHICLPKLNDVRIERPSLLLYSSFHLSDWIRYKQSFKENIYFSSEVYIICSPKEQTLFQHSLKHGR